MKYFDVKREELEAAWANPGATAASVELNKRSRFDTVLKHIEDGVNTTDVNRGDVVESLNPRQSTSISASLLELAIEAMLPLPEAHTQYVTNCSSEPLKAYEESEKKVL